MIKAIAQNHESGRSIDLVEVSPGDFERLTNKNPDFIGVPMFYCRKEGGYFKCWPHPQPKYTADFIGDNWSYSIETPIKLEDFL